MISSPSAAAFAVLKLPIHRGHRWPHLLPWAHGGASELGVLPLAAGVLSLILGLILSFAFKVEERFSAFMRGEPHWECSRKDVVQQTKVVIILRRGTLRRIGLCS
jgi:hypothetical protein